MLMRMILLSSMLLALVAIGCEAAKTTTPAIPTKAVPAPMKPATTPATNPEPTDSEPTAAEEAAAIAKEIAKERALLSAEDRKLVDAQEWCAISTEQRLGEMGAPIKLNIKGKPVFICCKGCTKKAEAMPDETLAQVEKLKEKAKAEK